MTVLHTIPSMGAFNGGTSSSVYELLKALQSANSDVTVVSLKSPLNDDLCQYDSWGILLDNDAFSPVHYSKNLKDYLKRQSPDIIHTNCLWSYCNHISAKVAREKGIPLVHTPHGMLFNDAIKRKYWKKWPLLQLWVNKDVKTAACLHATCVYEMENIRRFGYKGPIAVIPNAMPPIVDIDKIKENHCDKRIGFLGRLHPVKCVDNLIKAWKMLGEKVNGAELVLIGEGAPEYVKYLQSLAAECAYGTITFKGFINGFDKFQELATFRALCLISIYENFGMVVSEALSVGTTVIANRTTPWEDLNIHDCGWWIDATPEKIAETLEYVMNLNPERLKELGENGKKLIENKYSSKKVGEMMNGLYNWILGRGEKPDFVYTINN